MMIPFSSLRNAARWVGESADGPCSILVLIERRYQLVYTFHGWELMYRQPLARETAAAKAARNLK